MNRHKDIDRKAKKFPLTIVILISIFSILILYAGSYYFARHFLKDISTMASFGDSFGAVNALFSGAALAGIIITLVMQNRDLAYQREELELTRDEMEGQRKALEEQSKTLKIQRFESNFFSLLNTFENIISSIVIQSTGMAGNGKPKTTVAQGRDSFRFLVEEFEQQCVLPNKKINQIDQIVKAYEEFYSRRERLIGHYFRHLYNIIKYIDKSEILDKADGEGIDYRAMYAKITRSMLSVNEMLLIFYNCLTPERQDETRPFVKRFKPLVEKHSLLDGLDERYLCDSLLKNNYDDNAFGKNG